MPRFKIKRSRGGRKVGLTILSKKKRSAHREGSGEVNIQETDDSGNEEEAAVEGLMLLSENRIQPTSGFVVSPLRQNPTVDRCQREVPQGSTPKSLRRLLPRPRRITVHESAENASERPPSEGTSLRSAVQISEGRSVLSGGDFTESAENASERLPSEGTSLRSAVQISEGRPVLSGSDFTESADLNVSERPTSDLSGIDFIESAEPNVSERPTSDFPGMDFTEIADLNVSERPTSNFPGMDFTESADLNVSERPTSNFSGTDFTESADPNVTERPTSDFPGMNFTESAEPNVSERPPSEGTSLRSAVQISEGRPVLAGSDFTESANDNVAEHPSGKETSTRSRAKKSGGRPDFTVDPFTKNTCPSCRKGCFGHWRYESMRNLPRKEFYKITGVNQENFEVLYRFLGGDEMCDNLKYKYTAKTPTKKKRKLSPGSTQTGKCTANESSTPDSEKGTTRLTSRDKLFMTLVRLRRGFALEDLALLFGISLSQTSLIFYAWVQLLFLQFKRMEREMCVTRHDQPSWKIASCFRRYKNFRMVLDTTDIRIQAPKHYRRQGNTYSAYKAHNVILFLIGISGWGSICFISRGFEGAMSDRKILMEGRLTEFLEPGDLIMVDRGFRVNDVMDELGVTVVHPPSASKGKRLSVEDLMLTKRVGSDRSHVERAIRKVKTFNILKRVTNKMLPILDQLVCLRLSHELRSK